MKGVYVVLLLACAVAINATVYNFTPSNSSWLSTITSGLKPGDIVNLASGTYTLTSRFGVTWQGTASQPIIIQGVGSTAPIFYQTDDQNGIDISDSYYFLVQNVVFSVYPGCGGCKSVRLGTVSVHDAIFDTITCNPTATAFSANDAGAEYYNITLRNSIMQNTQETGECVYVGCQDNDCFIHDSLFTNNYCYNTSLANGGSFGSGFQIKTGSYNVNVSNNVCYKTRGPCVLFYDAYDKGTNIADGNVIISVLGDNAIQASAGAIIRNNIIMSAGASGIDISTNQLESGKHCRDVTIMFNTVTGVTAADAACLRFDDSGSTNINVANNALFCDAITIGNGASTPTFIGNAVSSAGPTGSLLVSSITTELADPTNRNYYPKSTSHLINNGTTAYFTAYDFNGLPRSATSPTIGAYQYSTSSNPGPIPAPGLKQFPDGAETTSTPGGTTGSSSSSSSAAQVCAAVSVFILSFVAML